MSTDKKVVLNSSDGEAFDMEEVVALEPQKIKHDCSDNGVPLTNVTSKILAKLVTEYCKKHVGDDPAAEDKLKNWDAEVDQASVIDLILANNYFSIKCLLDLACETVAAMIKAKTPEEIRKTLSIKNDFIAEEEEVVRRENRRKFQNKKHVSSTPSSSNSEQMEQCKQLLKRLMSHEHGWVFNAPVDTVKLNIPDYLTIVKHPMDLGTVKSKIDNGEYPSPLEFLSDVRLIFSNAMIYNLPGVDVHSMASQLRDFFEARWKAIEEKIPAKESVPPSKKMKVSSPGHERIMLKLTEDLQNIADLPTELIEFLRRQSSDPTADDELEIDIENMSVDTLFTLRKLVDHYMQARPTTESRKDVPCITKS